MKLVNDIAYGIRAANKPSSSETGLTQARLMKV
jgi:hypothetical protein